MREMPSLSPAKAAAFSSEIDEAAVLLAHGRRVLRELTLETVEEPVVFVCLGGGTEKLLKLTLLIVGHEDSGVWPDVSKWRHHITEMDETCRGLIKDRLHLSAATGYLGGLVDQVDSDRVLSAVLKVVTAYAVKGRFHNLDTLGAAATPTVPSPAELWQDLETRLTVADSILMDQLADPVQGQNAFTALCGRIETSVCRWQELYYRAWQHGVLGPLARQWSSALAPRDG